MGCFHKGEQALSLVLPLFFYPHSVPCCMHRPTLLLHQHSTIILCCCMCSCDITTIVQVDFQAGGEQVDAHKGAGDRFRKGGRPILGPILAYYTSPLHNMFRPFSANFQEFITHAILRRDRAIYGHLGGGTSQGFFT